MVEQLGDLNRNLEVLKDFDEFSNQRKIVDRFQDRVEQSLLPRLEKALEQRHEGV